MDLILSNDKVKEKYGDNEEVQGILKDVDTDAEQLMSAMAGNIDEQDHSAEVEAINEAENNIEETKKEPDKVEDIESLKSQIAMEGSISAIDEKLITPELAEFAIEFNKSDLQNIPTQFRTKQLCLTSLAQDPSQFKYVPSNIIDNTFISECITNNITTVKFIPESYLNVNIVNDILLQHPSLIRDIPNGIRPSSDVLNRIVKQVDQETREYMINRFNGRRKETQENHVEQQPQPTQQVQEVKNEQSSVTQNTTETKNVSENEKTLVERVKDLEDRLNRLEQKLGI